MTKTRQLIEQVCSPMIDRINVYKLQLSQLEKADKEWRNRVEALERIVIHKDDKDDAFQRMNARISQSDAKRKQECHRLECLYENQDKEVSEIKGKVEQYTSHLSNLDTHFVTLREDLVDLRGRTDSGLESLLYSLNQYKSSFEDSISTVNERQAKLESASFRHRTSLEAHDSEFLSH